nr:zinc finger, CCHC-type [Tanacetum cinerariifolium]
EYDDGNILLGDSTKCHVWGTCKVQVQIRDGLSFVLDNVMYVPKLSQNLISLGTLEKEGFTVKMRSGKIKVIRGSLVVLLGTRRDNDVYTLDGQAMKRKTLKGRQQIGEYQTGWKADDTTMSTYLVNRSPSSAIGFKTPIDMFRFLGWLASVKQRMLEPVKVLHRVEFEVEPQKDRTFEVESRGNIDHVVGSYKVQTQDLMDYHSARDREQHSARELFRYREDSNEAAFAVAAEDKIYAHESLTFHDTVACEVISKWKAGLKEDMDARSDVDRSGNILRVSQSRFYNEKLVQTLLEGSLSGECDVEKNCKWSCIYAVESLQVCHEVCMRHDIASTDVGMLDGFDRGLQTHI